MASSHAFCRLFLAIVLVVSSSSSICAANDVPEVLIRHRPQRSAVLVQAVIAGFANSPLSMDDTRLSSETATLRNSMVVFSETSFRLSKINHRTRERISLVATLIIIPDGQHSRLVVRVYPTFYINDEDNTDNPVSWHMPRPLQIQAYTNAILKVVKQSAMSKCVKKVWQGNMLLCDV